MKKLFLIIGLVAIAFLSKAQQLPLYSQYMMNGFLLNPAIAGSVDYTPVRITARSQWTGLNNYSEGYNASPMTGAVSGHTRLSNGKMGAGGYIFYDNFGPISKTGIQASYAYHLDFPELNAKLGMGLSISAFQYKLDETDLGLLDENDAAITYSVESSFIPDANFGLYFYSPTYYAGLAINQLIELDAGIEGANKNPMVRHYFLTGGYKFVLNDKFDLEPSVLLKGTEMESPFQLDFNLKTYFMKNYWLGLSYRTGNAMVCILGVKYDMYYLGYAFDYSFSTIKNYSSGSHEIMLGVNFGEDKMKGSTLL